MKHIYIIIIAFTCLASMCGVSCRVSDAVSDDIATAEQAVDARDYGLARSICETFTTDSTSTLRATELCRLSLVYMKLSDVDNADINTAAATQCYQSAMRVDSDSARFFYDNVPIDEARHVEILTQLDRILRGSRDIYIDEDSLGLELLNALDIMEDSI